ncbi:hypothetical protein KIPB_002564 [Kipferlia bialata]|uniref:EF-hand domain-containing protein n=1 Tax=Kipferlia bialata TaxID=797122 RepID=A0A9K3CR03_9EUKA|nr:hypothetical protein KIPB_002564 [Kipferlia bialata]|eukprot:g2564.t1
MSVSRSTTLSLQDILDGACPFLSMEPLHQGDHQYASYYPSRGMVVVSRVRSAPPPEEEDEGPSGPGIERDEKTMCAKETASKAMIHTTKFDASEDLIRQTVNRNKPELRRMWRALDYNGNGLVSLAEIDKWIVETRPELHHKPALIRAYFATVHKTIDTEAWRKHKGDNWWVVRRQFVPLLRNIFYFNKLFHVFQEMDLDTDRRCTLQEFSTRGVQLLGLDISQELATEAFHAIDRNKGGYVLFDEFAAWVTANQIPVD